MRVDMDEPTEHARRLRAALGQALRDARTRAGLRNQDLLAELLGTTQQTVSRYENGDLTTLDDVVAIEDALGLGRGALLVAAGYVPEDIDVLDLIRRDLSITENRRELIIEVYETGRARAADQRSD